MYEGVDLLPMKDTEGGSESELYKDFKHFLEDYFYDRSENYLS